ncbi:hypothetical protein BOX15_Mlig022769g3 [Macrostomum lignano]|uniref:CSP domain-containing protein n=2 Tax=Macrostomum lignano TaxID=282301 RepID=A0A1I8I0C0_9PLAT|nr:hypothetical protein BOX15_Mlig022769g3 [Macrostomum lignano]
MSNSHKEKPAQQQPPVGSPSGATDRQFSLPSPIVTRRNRTLSQSERARLGPTFRGVVREFCRNKGHGFIVPSEGDSKTALFVHISDIEEEFVPMPGDEVEYKMILVPPKNEKYQAVHVRIVHLAPNVKHHKWSEPEER